MKLDFDFEFFSQSRQQDRPGGSTATTDAIKSEFSDEVPVSQWRAAGVQIQSPDKSGRICPPHPRFSIQIPIF
jgi:hypothetical protein